VITCQNRVFIIDKATASIDIGTNSVIQKALRLEFKDVITTAHRLNTVIDYDKVLILNQDNIFEYDKPINLLFEPQEKWGFSSKG